MTQVRALGRAAVVCTALVLAVSCTGAEMPTGPEPTPSSSLSAESGDRPEFEVATVELGAGRGTGFVVSDDGHVLTTNLAGNGVLGGPATVTFTNGETYEASVVGLDARSWLALVEMRDPPLVEAVRFGNSVALNSGQPAWLVGASISLTDATPVAVGDRTSVVGGVATFDVAMAEGVKDPNPAGGGVVVNDAGHVMGMVVLSTNGGRIHSAIPAGVLERVTEEMLVSGSASQPFLGVSVAQRFGGGVVVESVSPDSPANLAGLLEGDVIVRVDDQPVDDVADMAAAIQGRDVGDVVNLNCQRDGQEVPIVPTLEDRPPALDYL